MEKEKREQGMKRLFLFLFHFYLACADTQIHNVDDLNISSYTMDDEVINIIDQILHKSEQQEDEEVSKIKTDNVIDDGEPEKEQDLADQILSSEENNDDLSISPYTMDAEVTNIIDQLLDASKHENLEDNQKLELTKSATALEIPKEPEGIYEHHVHADDIQHVKDAKKEDSTETTEKNTSSDLNFMQDNIIDVNTLLPKFDFIENNGEKEKLEDFESILSLNDQTPNEGKHFILTEQGLYLPQAQDVVPEKKDEVPTEIKAYFSPDDNVQKIVEELIDKEEESLKIAIFSFTDPRIAKAIQRACKRGVQVEIVTDHSCLRDRLSTIGELADYGCSIYAYSPSLTTKSSCMHNKFILAKKNCGGSCLLTGSYNFTRSAAQANQENVLMIKSHEIFERYEEQFEVLKRRSYRYGRSKTVFINARRGFITTIPS